MVSDPARTARLRAYRLMEAAQGHDRDRASAQLALLESEGEAHGWSEAAYLAAAGQVMCTLLRRHDATAVDRSLEALLTRAEPLGAPALSALALALRAVSAAGRDQVPALLGDAARAVVLVDDPELPALDRCTVLVVCAAAYDTLGLWELVDELYDAAAALGPDCDEPVQAPAVAVNRMLIRIEWAAALLELGEERAALDQLHRAAVAARLALEVDIPQPLWRLDARVCRDLVDFVLQAYGEPATVAAVPLGTLDAHRVELLAAGDVEVVPMLDAFVALALLRSGRRLEALARLAEEAPRSMVAGAGSFPAWARAQALTGDAPDAALRAQRDYGARVARDRWNARLGMLAAARAGIAHRRLSLEHAVLARDVLLDPLTGLSNRRCFDDWLADVPDRPRGTALLLIDLDDFKVVNDLHGHAVGDEALRKVGRVIAGHVRPGDMALRLGGDEFALVLFDDVPEVPAPAVEALRAVAADRARALRTAVELSDWGRIAPGLTLTLSVGLAAAVLGPESPGGAARLYREADADLYVQKDHADVSAG